MNFRALYSYCFDLVPKVNRKLIRSYAFIFALLNTIDIAGIALIGISIASLAGLTNQKSLQFFNLWLSGLFSSNTNLENIYQWILIIGIMLLLCKGLIALYFYRRLYETISHIATDLSSKLASSLLSKDVLWLGKWNSHQLIYGTGQGITNLLATGFGSFVILIAEAVLLTLIVLLLLFINFWIALFALVFFGLTSSLIQIYLGRSQKDHVHRRSQANIRSNHYLQEALLAIREIKMYRAKDFIIKRYSKWREDETDSAGAVLFYSLAPKYIFEMILMLGLFLVLITSFTFQTRGEAVVTIAFFSMASSRMLPSLVRLQSGLNMANDCFGLRMQLNPLIQELSTSEFKIEETQDTSSNLNRKLSGIYVNNLSFQFPDSTFCVVIDEFRVLHGSHVAIVGPSGSGKSTFFELILGTIPPDRGEILVGDASSHTNKLNHSITRIAFVPQKVSIFDASISLNIALKENLSVEEQNRVWSNLEVVGLDTWAKNLPQLLETNLGEFGSRLSGGQLQRLGLARALYHNPEILLLDEATSSLDARSENIIRKTLSSLKGKVTIISIVHKMNSLRDMDEIFYFDDGKLVAHGDFDKLNGELPDFIEQFKLWNA